jgi:hypothetical protein
MIAFLIRQHWPYRRGAPPGESARRADAHAAEIAIRVADAAGELMKLQWEVAARYNYKGRVTGATAWDAGLAFACGFLRSALQLRGVEWSPGSSQSMSTEAAVQLAGYFARNWLSTVEPQDVAKAMLAVALNTQLDSYKEAGAIAFQHFRERIDDKIDEKALARCSDDFARALGLP